MPREFQLSSDLGLHGLPFVEDGQHELGMHLRWGFAASIGFPAFGFELHRREARGKYKRRCVRLSGADLLRLEERGWVEAQELVFRLRRQSLGSATTTTLSSNALRRFDIEIPEPRVLTDISLHPGTDAAFVVALRKGRAIAAKVRASSDPPTVVFAPIVVDGIVVFTAGRGPSEVCFADELGLTTEEWTSSLLPAPGSPEFGYGLPLTHGAYNLHHRFENPSEPAEGDWEEAKARMFDGTMTVDDFVDLREALSVLVDPAIPGRMFDREIRQRTSDPDPDTETMLERPLDWALAASIDPTMARVLGLYFVDRGVDRGKVYDYALVGRWSGWQLSTAAKVYSFAAVPDGTYVPKIVSLCGAALHLPTGTRITVTPAGDGPGRKSLAVRGRHLFFTSLEPFSMRFTRLQRWVRVELGSRERPLSLTVRRDGVRIASGTAAAGSEPVVIDLDPGQGGFNELRITGGDFDLFGVRAIDATPDAPAPDELDDPIAVGTIALGVRFDTPAELGAPSSLELGGITLPIPEPSDRPAPKAPLGLRLAWRPPPSPTTPAWPTRLGMLGPTEAAGYHVRYQYLGDGAAANPVDAANWVIASSDPVALTEPSTDDERQGRVHRGDDLCVLFPEDPPPPRGDDEPNEGWLEPWVPAGWFAAGVRSVDVFGRTSTWSDAGPSWVDTDGGPSPPIGVEARLLEASDPSLTPEEAALVASHGDGSIRVRWSWPPQLRRASPLATHFRLYFHPRPFNRWRVVVQVAAPASPTTIRCTIDLDEAIAADALVGGLLVDSRAQRFEVISNAAGASVELTLKRWAADPSRLPTSGVGALQAETDSPVFEAPGAPASWAARVARVDITADTRYEAVIPPIGFAATAAEPTRHGVIGVSAADDSPRHPDAFGQPTGPPWDAALGDLPGREGGVSPGSPIVSVFREPPGAPPEPTVERVFTSRPDFEGRAHYTLRWTNVPPPRRAQVRWKVYRTTDAAVAALYEPSPEHEGIDRTGLPAALIGELDAALAEGDVRRLSDHAIRTLAANPAAKRAFILATASPFSSADDEVEFVDSVEAINRVRYLYRTRVEDLAENLSPLGPVAGPVYVPLSLAPAAVVVTRCQGGERSVELEFRPNAEDEVGGYLVFSTEDGVDRASLEELRVLRRGINETTGSVEGYDRDGFVIAPTVTLTRAEAEAAVVDGFINLRRTGLRGGAMYHYRVVAVDVAGNPSAPTRMFSARTFGVERPSAPTWGPAMRTAGGLSLQWTSPHDDLNCLVERSLDSGQTWTAATGWLGRGNYQATVDDLQSGALYRLRVVFRNGQPNTEFDPLEA